MGDRDTGDSPSGGTPAPASAAGPTASRRREQPGSTGQLILPYLAGGPAQENVDRILGVAMKMGCEIPDAFVFVAGQLFLRDGEVEEVRLGGRVQRESGGRLVRWNTPTPPRFTDDNGRFELAPADVGRQHITALRLHDTTNGHDALFFWWDTRTGRHRTGRFRGGLLRPVAIPVVCHTLITLEE